MQKNYISFKKNFKKGRITVFAHFCAQVFVSYLYFIVVYLRFDICNSLLRFKVAIFIEYLLLYTLLFKLKHFSFPFTMLNFVDYV